MPTYHVKKNGNYEFYLNDHCFSEIPKINIMSFCICDWRYWVKYSDHMPLIIDSDDNNIYLKDRPNFVAVKMWRVMINSKVINDAKSFKSERGKRFLKYGDFIKEQ